MDDDYYDDEPGCPECGDEGFIWRCFDGFCLDAEEGCDDCTYPCPVCTRPKQNKIIEGLREVLGEALEKHAERAANQATSNGENDLNPKGKES